MDGVAGEEAGIFAGAAAGKLGVEGVGLAVSHDVYGGFLGVERESAGGLNRFAHGEVGGPGDAAGALDFTANVNEALGHAHGHIDCFVEISSDVGLADAGRKVGGGEAGGGHAIDVGQGNEALVVDLEVVGGRGRDALEHDAKAVTGAEEGGGGGLGYFGVHAGGAGAGGLAPTGKSEQGNAKEAGDDSERPLEHDPSSGQGRWEESKKRDPKSDRA